MWRLSILLLLFAVLPGCRTSPVPAGTGAEAAVREYYAALVRKDWQRAYAALHPATRSKVSPAQFTRLAESYRGELGFEPEKVVVRSCEEHGEQALAHVVIKPGSGSRSYKDAVELRQTEAGWAIVPSPKFGQRRY